MSPVIVFAIWFFAGVALGLSYSYAKQRRLAKADPDKRDRLSERLRNLETAISIFNVTLIGGTLAGLVITRAAGLGFSLVALGAFATTATFFVATHAFGRWKLLTKARAAMASTFGGGNRGYLFLLLLLSALQLDQSKTAAVVAYYYLIDLGNFLILLTYIQYRVGEEFGVQKISSTPTTDEVKRANKVLKLQKPVLMGSALAVIVGAALSLSPEIQPVVPTLTSILSKVLLFVATATMFASLAEDTTARRSIIDTVGIFVVVRMIGATIVAAALVVCYWAGMNMNVLFAALSLLVLFFTPPSSLIDDIFVVQGADSEISDTVKRDSAVMNLIFVSAIVGIYLISQTGQFLVAVL